MIILPERNRQVGKVLVPQRNRDWYTRRRSIYGIEDTIMFRLTARLDDGKVVWKGFWRDRDEADDFLWHLSWYLYRGDKIPLSVLRSTDPRQGWPEWSPMAGVHYQFECMHFLTDCPGSEQEWRCPPDWRSPGYLPPFDEDVLPFWAIQTIYTTPIATNTNINLPGDWNISNNSSEAIGAGAYGGTSSGGGGGGSYSKYANMGLTAGTLCTYYIGDSPAAPTTAYDSWFRQSSTYFAWAKGGASSATGSGPGGAGGSGGQGTTMTNGGAGGSMSSIPVGGGGGGGAGGPGGAGGSGGGQTGGAGTGGGGGGGAGGPSSTSGSPGTSANGGAGGNGPAGTGGGSPGADGTAGTGGGGGGGNVSAIGAGSTYNLWATGFGPGGGGGGGVGIAGQANPGYYGGLYGGAGGGGGFDNFASLNGGQGRQGIVVLIYIPAVAGVKYGFNMPMLGM